MRQKQEVEKSRRLRCGKRWRRWTCVPLIHAVLNIPIITIIDNLRQWGAGRNWSRFRGHRCVSWYRHRTGKPFVHPVIDEPVIAARVRLLVRFVFGFLFRFRCSCRCGGSCCRLRWCLWLRRDRVHYWEIVRLRVKHRERRSELLRCSWLLRYIRHLSRRHHEHSLLRHDLPNRSLRRGFFRHICLRRSILGLLRLWNLFGLFWLWRRHKLISRGRWRLVKLWRRWRHESLLLWNRRVLWRMKLLGDESRRGRMVKPRGWSWGRRRNELVLLLPIHWLLSRWGRDKLVWPWPRLLLFRFSSRFRLC